MKWSLEIHHPSRPHNIGPRAYYKWCCVYNSSWAITEPNLKCWYYVMNINACKCWILVYIDVVYMGCCRITASTLFFIKTQCHYSLVEYFGYFLNMMGFQFNIWSAFLNLNKCLKKYRSQQMFHYMHEYTDKPTNAPISPLQLWSMRLVCWWNLPNLWNREADLLSELDHQNERDHSQTRLHHHGRDISMPSHPNGLPRTLMIDTVR